MAFYSRTSDRYSFEEVSKYALRLFNIKSKIFHTVVNLK